MNLSKGLMVAGVAATAATLMLAPTANAASLRITVDNLAPSNGTALTPTWFGFHDGTFDLYNRNEAVTPGLESLAEDGDSALLNSEFLAAGGGTVQGVVGGPGSSVPGPILPQAQSSFLVDLDTTAASSQYFSYAAMVLPSNDFFIANGNPLAHQIFDDAGSFLGADFVVAGAEVLDAGTEVNDESPENTAFFGQTAPNTGVTENGVVTLAEDGFIPGGNILSSDDFFNGDFTADGYNVARIRVELVEDDATAVPEPGSILALFAVGGFLASRKFQQA
ncbi:MAG: spondin domain-containing protein [Cyanobacteria bacterium J06643_4]